MTWLAVDGEAEDGHYALMCDSDGRSVYKRGGLTTKECLDFLLEGRSGQAACFGLNYDANNWLVDVPAYRLQELWTDGDCTYVVGGRRYRIEWIPGKWFRVSRGKPDERKTVTINEVWGYFQSTFVKACERWGLEVQPELAVMKAKRGTFTKAELPRVTAYCMNECELLSALMQKIEDQCEQLEIKPRRWIGAGSLAGALLEKHDMKRFLRHDMELTQGDGLTAILRAYFGGRVEMYRQGDFSDVHSYDINSAYPAAAVHLPPLDNVRFVHKTKYDAGIPHGIWRVKWDLRKAVSFPFDPMVPPFPCRVRRGIYYPLSGEGCYHAVEVRAAISAGYPIEVIEGWELRQKRATKAQPFGWVPDVYAERARMKAEGDHGEKVLKLALNSVYGKLAQGKGFKDKSPTWQSYFWAGEITATTRARMLSLATKRTPLMISTDGIFFDGPLDIETSEGLGGITHSHLAEMWIGQPGVYWGADADGTEVIRSRGFFARDVDYSDLRAGYAELGSDYVHSYGSTRFIGLGVSLQRNDLSQWRTWREEIRQIKLAPTRRDSIEQTSIDGLATGLQPPPGPMESEPYVPKGGLLAGASGAPEDHLQGLDQPLRNEA